MKQTDESLALSEAPRREPEQFNYRTVMRDAQPHSAAIAKLKNADPVLRPIG